jgi:hypothetical protein
MISLFASLSKESEVE